MQVKVSSSYSGVDKAGLVSSGPLYSVPQFPLLGEGLS